MADNLTVKDIADAADSLYRTYRDVPPIPEGYLASHFPHSQWMERQAIYQRLKYYYSGEYLKEKGDPNDDNSADKYPLRINVIKTFVQRLSFVLAGEIPDDATSAVNVECDIRFREFFKGRKPAERKPLAPMADGATPPMPGQNGAKSPVNKVANATTGEGNKANAVPTERKEQGQEEAPSNQETRTETIRQEQRGPATKTEKEVVINKPKPEEPALPQPTSVLEPEVNPMLDILERLAAFTEDALNMIWQQSNARSIQMEAFNICQWMYGVVFQLLLVEREDLLWPFQIRVHTPDYFMPIWSADDPEHLIEAWIIRYITPEEALLTYEVKLEDKEKTNVVYVEHWREKDYRITVNGKPIKGFSSEGYNEHKFGRVPLWYVPAMRDGSYWGAFSVIEKIAGLSREYNARLGDVGDAIYLNVNRKRWIKNALHTPTVKTTTDGVKVYDMGQGHNLGKNPPEITFEEAPNVNPSITKYYMDIWSQMIRECSLSPIVFGEDEGSQRSGMTLAFRMWPMTALTGGERSFFSVAFNSIGQTLFNMIVDNRESPMLKTIFALMDVPDFPEGAKHFISIGHQWHPQIPRDAAELIQNTLALTGGELLDKISGREVLQLRNPELIEKRLAEQKQRDSELAQAQAPVGGAGAGAAAKSPISNKPEPAKIDTGIPTNQIILGEQEGED